MWKLRPVKYSSPSHNDYTMCESRVASHAGSLIMALRCSRAEATSRQVVPSSIGYVQALRRPVSLQQHVHFQHHQRVARKVATGQPYNLELALAFTVLQLQQPFDPTAQEGPLDPFIKAECSRFSSILHSSLSSLSEDDEPAPITTDRFPGLLEHLLKFSMTEYWKGMTCTHCGRTAQKKSTLDDHLKRCVAYLRKYDRSTPRARKIKKRIDGLGCPSDDNPKQCIAIV